MLELVPVVSAGSCGIWWLEKEPRDGHRGEEGTEAEHNQIQIVLVSL